MKVFVIVVTYNGAADMPHFLDSFKKYTPSLSRHSRDDGNPDNEVELVVVDNNSHDETVSIVLRDAPFAYIIENTENRGFTGGNNVGMQYAISKGAEYIMLVNQDIRFEKDWLAPLVLFLHNNPDVGAVQSKIMLHPQIGCLNSCGNALHYLGFGFTRGYLKTEKEYDCANSRDVAYCSFSAVLLRVSVLKKCGLFDDSFFMYHEDSDLCWRMRLLGFRCCVEPASKVYHHYEFTRSIQKFYYIERNRFLVVLRNYSIKTLVLIAPLFVIWEIGLLFMSLVGFLFMKKTIGLREKLRAYGYFFSGNVWAHVCHTRSAIQKSRCVADKDIVSLFTDTIEFQDVSNLLLTRVANPITRVYWKIVKRLI
ncbi:glycosyltransferase family 2 protein [Candidatus Uhrbacteria bacterium]|nr:glycosyltransferase family 2 protein [Candidatus Uhrbacteria bacterium]